MELVLKNITKKYNQTVAVDDVSITVPSGKIVALVGPSGCGKTTILRVIAGLVSPDQGQVFLNSQDITQQPANQRPTVTVFQEYALFPHLSVFDNIAYGLKTRHIKKEEIKERVTRVLNMLKILELKDRRIHELSGGQQQRVAVARSLVINPQVILFDEPLSSLDAKLRVEMREEIKKIQRETEITAVYVTHDQEEALAVADQLAVMRDGKIEQIGTPEEVYENPLTSFVGQFIGWGNLFSGEVIANSPEKIRVSLWGREMLIKPDQKRKYLEKEPVEVFFRPENVIPQENGTWEAEILQKFFCGPTTRYRLKVEGFSENNPIIMDLFVGDRGYQPGEKIRFNIRSSLVLAAFEEKVFQENN
ncbi:ABC transporter ATP-binding protein [Candidatus Contubernalis alkaliaceticus]|uniref:ABC transporter ATP-binding protein n=1 Tax=Candidatus Contubernalis alkaliaceticus TaxID=338645 RepID=UPI001F4C0939|nr:ABC transporter ATP-binding protein [Candidatus Contubernalis alkalaceticus]UNC90836.1 ABC transporter ATP-binding protein [Candidatus Contubernalis alkalaceticus]